MNYTGVGVIQALAVKMTSPLQCRV